LSRPSALADAPLAPEDARLLRRVARLTWRYFEVFNGAGGLGLPPDNVQEQGGRRVAGRCSPTDLGLALLADLAAYDLGYLGAGGLLERCERTVGTMEGMERHRGHFLNWYDSSTGKALRPRYVSTVDSGNLVGHLRVLRSGLLELASAEALPPQARAGLLDTLDQLAESGARGPAVAALRRLLEAGDAPPLAQAAWLQELSALAAAASAEAVAGEGNAASSEAVWWASALQRQLDGFGADLRELAAEPGDGEGAAARRRRVEALAARCAGLADAEFGFLYDPRRHLFSIGYSVDERRLDPSYYDLLASEARLASYLAIASGQIPFEHWFALGRRLTSAGGSQVLLSWSGSMFEYLMPLLVMPSFRGTLLDQTCRAAVARQRDYGLRQGIPWGISESSYNLVDAQGTYQYRAFGVPELGLQRGLGDDRVVSPYATLLALMVDPRRACANLRRLAARGCLGAFGFYEAVDFGPARLGGRGVMVRSFMAHHQGMGLLALERALLGPRMQDRFLAHADLRSAALLLQERIPREAPLLRPFARESLSTQRGPAPQEGRALRVLKDPDAAMPALQLLSNGRYHVMVTAAGGGYSRWNGVALTRWRQDAGAEDLGVFFYVDDEADRRSWSAAHQPSLRRSAAYEAVFTPGLAEFRRRDGAVDTHTQIAVSPEDDLELRRLTLTNRSEAARSIRVTAYTEIVLAAAADDELHRAFSGLFVHTELLPGQHAILATRRPRSAGEAPPWLFCLMPPGEDPGAPGASSFETDRGRFLGRGRGPRHPAQMEAGEPLEGTAGAVLDPCAALRCQVELGPEGSVSLDLILGAAATREAALALIAKYQDHRMADRVFEVAETHSRAVLARLGAGDAEANRYAQLASGVVFPLAVFRAPASILRRNRKGQAGLWGYALSGDLPIVLLRVGNRENLGLVADLLKAHAYWRMLGLEADLVVWNEDASGYRRDLNDEILGLVAAGAQAHWLDRPGGVFVRSVDAFPEEDRVLLLAVARIVVRDVDGPLDAQLQRWLAPPAPDASPPAVAVPLALAAAPGPAPARRGGLLFPNGSGGFTPDGREYIVDPGPGRQTPAPWVNVIANARIGTVVSERGSAYTWYGNSQLCRLSPWSNDAVTDPSGEALFLRDEDSGRAFSALPWAGAKDAAYECRHGFGYSVFSHADDGLSTELSTYVATEAPVKFFLLKVRNGGAQARRVSVLANVDLVLGDLRSRNAMHVVTRREPLTGAILAHNSYSAEFPGVVAFLACSEPLHGVSGDRAEVLGRNGDPARPAALGRRGLSGRLGAGLDPCAAMQAVLDLPPGGEREIVFILGAADSSTEAVELVRRHRGVAAARVALKEVWRFWNDKLGVLYAETPDQALNVLVNGWLPYQVLSCRLWGRSGFQQSGGAYGYRDQLQDCLALLHEMPELARQHLLRCAGRQFVEGDVQHWWHPPSGRGVRTHCSDDYLWLPLAVARYVEFSGDTGVLDERVPYLTGRALNEGEESYYDLPGSSGQSGSLYEHCVRAIVHGLPTGAHGLPLMGGGDWNDGMNLVGRLGRGESVWLGFFLHQVLEKFGPVARARGDEPFAATCLDAAAALAGALEAHGWDGDWFLRAYQDDGRPLGSALNDECQIDALPQSWASMAAVGDPGRRAQALDAMWERLLDADHGILKLFSPPFDHGSTDPGYIKGYPPGIRENGGQYTHAAVWAAWALAVEGRGSQAEALVSMLNPIKHSLDPQAVARYRAEPYVMAADIGGEAPFAGRGGWTWYTGSAGWYYRLLHEVVLGLDRRGDLLTLRPRVPEAWGGFKLHYRYYQTFYHLDFRRDPGRQGPVRLVLDGQPLDGPGLRLVNDQREHSVEVHYGLPAG
jgi:cellobiose phosphorylase